MAKELLKRSEVKEEYTWNLKDMYASDEDWKKDLDEIDKILDEIGKMEGKVAALTGLDFSDILGQKNSKGKKNGEFLEKTFFEMEYDGYRIAICGEKDSKPEFVVYRGTIDNCFL